MAEVYCIGNGEVIIGWEAYVDYCKMKGLPLEYDPPKSELKEKI